MGEAAAIATAASAVSIKNVTGLLQVKADDLVGVAQVADLYILTELGFEIATAFGDDESPVNHRRPDDLPR